MLACGRPDGFDTGAGGFVCGGVGVAFGCTASSCAAGAADGAIAEMPAASNSRKRCARVVAGADDVVATGAEEGVVIVVPSAGNGSNVGVGAFEPVVAGEAAATVVAGAD